MKKIVFGIFGLLAVVSALAQQKPHYSQYMLNQYILNPALSGIESYADIKISHRHQWVGINDAPLTTYISAHMPLGMKQTNSYSSYGASANPRGSEYWANYEAPAPHHGVGVQIINDRTGPISYLSAYLTYAYHLNLNSTTNLAAGFGVGIKRIGLDVTKLTFGTPFDPSVAGSDVINRTKPDINAGLYLYSGNFFVGVSGHQLMPTTLDFSGDTVKTQSSSLVPHIFATAGYRILLGEDFNFTPSVMVKYLSNLPTQYDINAKIQYRDVAWAGAGFRLEDGYMAFAGLNISPSVSASYSYDFTTSRLNTYSRGTHEILIGFILKNGLGDTCPRNVW